LAVSSLNARIPTKIKWYEPQSMLWNQVPNQAAGNETKNSPPQSPSLFKERGKPKAGVSLLNETQSAIKARLICRKNIFY
jgi:hypothetical protein